MNPRGRHGARRLLVQALYQWQIGGHDTADLIAQFKEAREFASVDTEFFLEMLEKIIAGKESLDEKLGELADRPVSQLDPIERSILWIGIFELTDQSATPVKVIINEGVVLAKEFGSQDSFRYVNAILDNASGRYR
jgi:N utilization substance protein B